MAIKFAVRSDTFTAYHSNAGKDHGLYSSSDAVSVTKDADATAIGANSFNIFQNSTTTAKGIHYNGEENLSQTAPCSILIRAKLESETTFRKSLFHVGTFNGNYPSVLELYHDNTNWQYRVGDHNGFSTNISIANNPTRDVWHDIVVTWDGDTTTAGMKLYVDGSLTGSGDSTYRHSSPRNTYTHQNIYLGLAIGNSHKTANIHVNEFVIWDEVIDPTNITLVDPTTTTTSTGQTLNGASRTGWVDVSAFDGQGNQDPGVSNVRNGINYVIDGSTLTGELVAAAAPSGQSGTVDLNDIKEQIKTFLDSFNDTAATYDLSSNMINRVKQVLKVNPERIPIQASHFPCVTVYIDSKDIELTTIAKDQITANRECNIDIKVVGIVWNSQLTTYDEDPADEDLENLMENIELILRANPTLVGTSIWSKPTSVDYFSGSPDEQTHLRAGIINLEARVKY